MGHSRVCVDLGSSGPSVKLPLWCAVCVCVCVCVCVRRNMLTVVCSFGDYLKYFGRVME